MWVARYFKTLGNNCKYLIRWPSSRRQFAVPKSEDEVHAQTGTAPDSSNTAHVDVIGDFYEAVMALTADRYLSER